MENNLIVNNYVLAIYFIFFQNFILVLSRIIHLESFSIFLFDDKKYVSEKKNDNDINLERFQLTMKTKYSADFKRFLNSEIYELVINRLERMTNAEHKLNIMWEQCKLTVNKRLNVNGNFNDCAINVHDLTILYLGEWLCVEVGSKTPAALWCFRLVNKRSYFFLDSRTQLIFHPILFHFLDKTPLYTPETYSLPTFSVIYQDQYCVIKFKWGVAPNISG